MKIITFGTLKGGVGKTMLCFNLGGLLAQMGYRVLLVDSDLQGNLTANLGIERTAGVMSTLREVYRASPPSPDKLILPSPQAHLPGMNLIPSSIFLHRAELELMGQGNRELRLREYISVHRGVFEQYDYILIDTNPSMSIVNQNAFAASDAVLLVSDVSMNALEGAQLFIALWEESRMELGLSDNVAGLILNDLDQRNRLSTDFLEYLQCGEEVEDLRALMLQTVIPRNVRITESELAGQPISLYDIHSKGCQAITALAEELFQKKIL